MQTGLWLRVKALFRRRRFERDLQDEMNFHLAMREEKLRTTAGDGNVAASAKKEFGNPTQTAEQLREMRSFVFLETLWQDVRFGARLLRKNPVFTGIAIITLALGIGANTAIFSITYQILLQLLPVPHPEELVVLRSPGPKQGHVSSDGDDAASFSYPIYKDIRDRSSRVFSGVLARYAIPLSVSGLGNTERAAGELVSGNYFEVLGVRPALGRIFGPRDETSIGANRVAILSYGYWTRHFGNDPSVLNKQITVNGTLLTVVGVSRPGFTGVQIGQQPDIFIPITMNPQMEPNSNVLESRDDHWVALLARLKPGLSRSGAESALQAIFHPILEEDMPLEKISPRRKDQFLARKLLLDEGSHGRQITQTGTRGPLIMLSAMAGLVLIIACANLAGLLIARGEARQREIAVRLSLGASRRRVLRLLLTEGFLLATCGAAAGLVIAPLLLRTMVRSIPKSAGLGALHADLNLNLFFFALGISLASVLIFALFPALRLLRVSVQSQLKDQSNAASAGAAGAALRKWLIVTQVILTTVLLAAAGLFTRSLINLRFVHLGFNPDHLVEFSIAPELNGYAPAQEVQLMDRLRQNISGLPGVRSVSAAEIPVMADDEASGNITVEGYTTAENENTDTARLVGPGYFSTMNIPLLAGREFLESDTATSPKVAIINQKLVERYFAGRNPLGQRLMQGASNTRKPDIEIVGVVANSKSGNPRERLAPFMYLPYSQDPEMGHVTFYVRTSQDPASAANALRAALASVDSGLPVYALMTVGEHRDQSIFTERFMAALCVIMGLLAALLAAIGLYGLMAYICGAAHARDRDSHGAGRISRGRGLAGVE